MRLLLLGLSLALGLCLTAAFSQPSAASAGPLPAAPETYAIDGSHSAVLFSVQHLGVSYSYGRFNDIEGSYTFDEAKPTASKIQISIRADSVDTANDKRDQHLKSPDFFAAEQFPEITFASTKVAEKGKSLEVEGKLTLHGVEKPLTIVVDPVGRGDRGERFGFRSGFRTKFAVKRSDFDMKYMLEGLGDEVEVVVSVEGVRK